MRRKTAILNFMSAFFGRWVAMAVSVWAAAELVPGVSFHGDYAALALTALVLGILNVFLRPVLMIIAVLFNVIAFGAALGLLVSWLLLFFVNGFLLWLAGRMVTNFTVDTFWHGFLGALIISGVSFFINSLIGKQKPVLMQTGSIPSPTPPRQDDDVIDV